MSDIIDDDKVEKLILNSEANGFFVVVLPFFLPIINLLK
jgi:hypothetical protein